MIIKKKNVQWDVIKLTQQEFQIMQMDCFQWIVFFDDMNQIRMS